MRVLRSRILWGVLLIVVGGLLLLDTAGVLPAAQVLWPALFGITGLGFLYLFYGDREGYWWAAIPGFVLLGLAAASAYDGLLATSADDWSGAMFLACVGLGFVVVYLADHGRWWAVIPGGALLTLALIAGLSTIIAGTTTGGVLFLGLAATFGLLAMLPTPEGRMRWPLIPAAILALFGVLVVLEASAVLGFAWPAALILGGLYLVFRAFRAGGGTGRSA